MRASPVVDLAPSWLMNLRETTPTAHLYSHLFSEATKPRVKMLRMRRIGLALVVFLSANLCAKQNPDPQKDAQSTAPAGANAPASLTFKSHSDLVLVPVVVRGHKGKYIAGLSRDKFRLEENGKEQAITLFEEVQPLSADSTSPSESDRGYSNLPFDGIRPAGLTIIV